MSTNGWRAIDTAPLDGTLILLWGTPAGEISGIAKGPGVDVGAWVNGLSDYPGNNWWQCCTGDYYSTWINATHWMPLPPAPNATQHDGVPG